MPKGYPGTGKSRKPKRDLEQEALDLALRRSRGPEYPEERRPRKRKPVSHPQRSAPPNITKIVTTYTCGACTSELEMANYSYCPRCGVKFDG